MVRYQKLSDEEVCVRLTQVVEAEGGTITEDGYQAIIFCAEGDMRSALNILQSTWIGFENVTLQSVFKVCDQPPPQVLLQLVQCCLQGKVKQALAILRGLISKQGCSLPLSCPLS